MPWSRSREDLDAGAFTFGMATGIVSVAARTQGLPVVSDVLFALAALGWLVIAGAVVARGPRRPRIESLAVSERSS